MIDTEVYKRMWEFGANVNDTKSSAFPFWYEEALRAERESQSQSCSQAPTVPGPVHFLEHVQSLPPLVKSEQILHCISRKQAIFQLAEGHGGAHGNSA